VTAVPHRPRHGASPKEIHVTTQERSGQRIVVIGAGSAIGRQLARTASAEGAELVLAGPDLGKLKETAGELTGPWRTVEFDITDDASAARLADETGPFDHLVSTAAVPANGPLAALDPADVRRAFAAKVIGPLFLAKHLAGQAREGGSFTFFSGVAAWRLVQDAQLYFMDEPFAGVDAQTEKAIIRLLQELRTQGKTVVAVHHDLESAPDYFDWLVLLNVRKIASGPFAETFTTENLAKAYGGSVNLLRRQEREHNEARAAS
jgi:hypothetical protein